MCPLWEQIWTLEKNETWGEPAEAAQRQRANSSSYWGLTQPERLRTSINRACGQWGENMHTHTHTRNLKFPCSTHTLLPTWFSHTGPNQTQKNTCRQRKWRRLFTYSMMRSFEAFGLSANSWQLRTLNPYPSQACPLISADLMVIGSKPVFSTLKVLLRVKSGSLTFVSEINEEIILIINKWGICFTVIISEIPGLNRMLLLNHSV